MILSLHHVLRYLGWVVLHVLMLWYEHTRINLIAHFAFTWRIFSVNFFQLSMTKPSVICFAAAQRKKKIERKNKIWKINSTQLSSLVTRLSRRWERVRGAPHLVFTKKLTSLSLFSLTHIHFSIFFGDNYRRQRHPGLFRIIIGFSRVENKNFEPFFWRARHSILSDLNTSALKCWKWPSSRRINKVT